MHVFTKGQAVAVLNSSLTGVISQAEIDVLRQLRE